MKRILVTAFEPFGGETVNSGERAVASLPGRIGDWELCKRVIPVVYGQAAQIAMDAALEVQADAILCIGQAGGRTAVTPEQVAINLQSASIPDNAGNQPLDQPIVPGGAAAYFSTMPIRKMAEAIQSRGVPGRISYTAGTFVCNDLYYRLLCRFDGTAVRVGFLHVPLCREQGTPFLETSAAADAIHAAILALD